ncbi:M50 family metallopeptidase [Methanococcus aeolicus]|uniref:M50 family metallopeptidase n=1 Tax=Methanococcus aeolicus TaxID=42879 RepID=UPI0021C9EFED|nr:M50 family metallopeptidase [Methanococcus aeolicus]UXM84953.1 site-2 protease family protein [Methanococcus aeolicus]
MEITSTNILMVFLIIWSIIYIINTKKQKLEKKSDNGENEYETSQMGLKIYYGLFGILRTSAGLKIIDKVGKYKFWRKLSLWLIPICMIISILTLYMFITSTINLFSGTVSKETSKPIIFLFGNLIPWIPGIVALIIGITLHELAHGIVARAYNLKIKSTGLLLGLGIPLGAFVELSDEFKDTNNKIRGAVASAGPIANVIIFVIAIFAMPFAMNMDSPITISNVAEDYPAQGVLLKGDVIYSINDHKINSLTSFQNAVKDIKPNEKIKITILRNNKLITINSITTSTDGLIGINAEASAGISFILQTLYWTSMLNLMLGFFNLLPALPLDGFHIWNALPELIRDLRKDNKLLNKISMITEYLINERSLTSISLMVWGLIFISMTYSFM